MRKQSSAIPHGGKGRITSIGILACRTFRWALGRVLPNERISSGVPTHFTRFNDTENGRLTCVLIPSPEISTSLTCFNVMVTADP